MLGETRRDAGPGTGLCDELPGIASVPSRCDLVLSRARPVTPGSAQRAALSAVLAFVLLMPVMPFSFSFSLTVPGLTNPFSSPPEPEPSPPTPRLARLDAGSDIQGYRGTAPIRRAPSPSLQPPLSRKRGWVPSAPEYSSPTANPTSTSGYLDTPAKYRDMASAYNEGGEVEEMIAGVCLIRPLCGRTVPAGTHAGSDIRRVKSSMLACGIHVFACRPS